MFFQSIKSQINVVYFKIFQVKLVLYSTQLLLKHFLYQIYKINTMNATK